MAAAMRDDLSLEEIADLRDLGPDAYRQRVLGLFLSHRATAAQWEALAEAILHVSESVEGHLVVGIDRAILARSRQQEG